MIPAAQVRARTSRPREVPEPPRSPLPSVAEIDARLARKHGLEPFRITARPARLADTQAIVRRVRLDGMAMPEIAEGTGLRPGTISAIAQGRQLPTRRHLAALRALDRRTAP